MKKQTISSREQKKNSFYLITTTGTVQYSIYCNCFFTLTHSNGHGQSHRKSVATKAIEKDEFNLFFQIDRGNELNKFCPQTDATTFVFASVFILLLRDT